MASKGIKKDALELLESNSVYHIYNRANGFEKLFVEEENYRYFLSRVRHYILPMANIYFYCLMPNHFHLLIGIRDLNLAGLQDLQGFRPFGHLFNSYAKAFNKRYKRKGSLFMRNFKRIKVEDEEYMRKLIHYIHRNPVEAGLAQETEEWKHSSYRKILSRRYTWIEREMPLELYGGAKNFRYCHKFKAELLL